MPAAISQERTLPHASGSSCARRAAWTALVVAAISGGARTAAGAPPPVTLEWDAPADCPTRDLVLRETARILGDAGGATIAGSARVARVARGRWSAELRVASASGIDARTLSAPSCAAIADATALILALAVNPTRATQKEPAVVGAPVKGEGAATSPSAPVPEAPSASPIELVPSPVPPGAPLVAPARSAGATAPTSAAPASGATPATAPLERHDEVVASRDHRFAAGLAGGVDVGTLPRLASRLNLTVAWLPLRRLRAELSLGAGPSQRATSAAVSNAGGDFQLWSGSLQGCYGVFQGWASISPCAGLEIDSVSAAGFGADTPLRGAGTWAALAAGGLVSWEILPWLAVRAKMEALAPLYRYEFAIDGIGVVHRPARLAGHLLLGLEVRFF